MPIVRGNCNRSYRMYRRGGIVMGYCVRLIVPTDRESELAPIVGRIVGRWDGCTVTTGYGWWNDKTRTPVKDALSVVECSVKLWDHDTRIWWYDLATGVCRTFGQDCVFLSVSRERATLVNC